MSTADSSSPTGWLSIGDVARLAGSTTRAVRHYHAIGLLAEPPRDSSGYRRYGAGDLIAMVRVARLRALGMPIPQIAERMAERGPSSSEVPAALPASLTALADELDREIERLVATRDRLRELAGSETFDQPVETLKQALRGRGLLGPDDELAAGEESAASLLDALHPQGLPGVLDQAGGLLDDPAGDAQRRFMYRLRQRLDGDDA